MAKEITGQKVRGVRMKILEKVWDTLGLYEYVDEEEETRAPEPQYRSVIRPVPTAYEEANMVKKASNNVVSLPVTNKQIKVMVVTPKVFDDAQAIADHIRSSKPVVVNFENTGIDVMKRIIDFISGTVYALNGSIKLVGNNIMICAPSNVDIDENQMFASDKEFSLWKS